MKNLFELCKPREDVFKEFQQDDALDLANLADNSIDAKLFFDETYVTSGMNDLVDKAFSRFAGVGTTGLIRLKQAMGGGKTHNMVALGLLARYPEYRKYMQKDSIHGVSDKIRVVSYTGRNSDIPYGLWGEIAKQIGKFDQFRPYYNPVLAAPGQNAWIELLKGEPVLILLDEMPPYLSYLRTRQVGTGTLADITVTALANLFNALNKPELSNVCVVISDLNATYDNGSELINKSFKDIDGEISRTAINIEPVKATSDDLYLILKKRLFESLPEKEDIIEVATEYKDAVNKAKQVNTDISTNANLVYQGICDVYPFHPCIKDLFARFKENNNFQQTRGFIRLARLMVRRLFENDGALAKAKNLINAYDYDLSDNATFAMIKSIKPKLEPAISHDVYGSGRSAAEEIDMNDNSTDMQEIAKMILMSSLGDVVGAVKGLAPNEIIGNMVMPGRDMSNFKKLIENYRGKAWYLYSDKLGKLFFRDIQNVNAQMTSIVSSYSNEQAKQEIRKILEKDFAPKVKDCYQKVLVFPAIDEIELNRENNTLILFEPNSKGGLSAELYNWFMECNYPNRVMFLSGQRDTMNNLLEAAKEQKAIVSIIGQLKSEKVAESDTQYQAALDLQNRVEMRINSAIKETFVTLYYPATPDPKMKRQGIVRGYRHKEIEMKFENNNFNAEDQVRTLLTEVRKFMKQEETASDTFKKKIEARLFTTRKMLWKDILERAAVNTEWNWYYPTALREAKDRYIANGFWIEEGDMIDKEPPVPKTGLRIVETSRNGEDVTLKLVPENGDVIRWEIEQDPTSASPIVKDLGAFRTNEMSLSFICEDSTGKYEVGEVKTWTNKVEVQYNFFDDANGIKRCELEATNSKVKIMYSTNGSNPRNGAVYNGSFVVPKDASILLAVSYYEPLDLYGAELRAAIPAFNSPSASGSGGKAPEPEIVIDNAKSLKLKINKRYGNNADVYQYLSDMKKIGFTATLDSINVADKKNDDCYFDITCSGQNLTAEQIENMLDTIRQVVMKDVDTKVELGIAEMHFTSGQSFRDWIAASKDEIKNYKGCIEQ